MIGIIAAVTVNGVIGVDGKLPFDYPEDMKHFRKTTAESVVIMGRKTFEGIGRPLPKRENIVITSRTLDVPGITCLPSIKAAMDREKLIFRDKATNIWFIGGASIYEEGMSYADEIVLTLTPDYERHPQAVKFPWINPDLYQLINTDPLVPEDINCKLRIARYRRKTL